MTTMETTDIRDLASILAEVIRRMGAAYGSAEEWRRDIKHCVNIMERWHAKPHA